MMVVSKDVKQYFIPPLTELYFIRINSHDSYLEIIQAEFSQTSVYSNVLCVEHHGKEGNNKHYHLALKTYRKNQALRVHLKSLFTLGSGNAHLSLKRWDGDSNVLSYMFHEDTSKYETPIILNNYSPGEIAELKSKSYTVKKGIGDNSPVVVCKIIFDLLPKTNAVMYSRESIVVEFMRYYHSKGSWQPNRFQLDRYYKCVQSMYYKYQSALGLIPADHTDSLFEYWYNDMYGIHKNYDQGDPTAEEIIFPDY